MTPTRSNPSTSASTHSPAETAGTAWDLRERLYLTGVLVALFLGFAVHLRSVVISDMDEGTYLYAGELITRGLTPYRHFLLAHPPLIALLGAGCYELFGPSIVAARFVYLAVVLLATIPLYALVRQLTSSALTALIGIVTYACGMLLIANMGRTVRLEPFMNVFLICGVYAWLARPRSLWFGAAAGMLCASALFVKIVAVVPIAMLFLGDLLFLRSLRSSWRRWSAALAGALLIAVPAFAWCFAQPHFYRDVLLGQVSRPRLDLATRSHYLLQNLTRYPPILFGLIAAVVLVLRARDARTRILGLLAAGTTIVLFLAFKTFFNYYIVQALPWIACAFAIGFDAATTRWLGAQRARVIELAFICFAVVTPAAYAEYYNRTAAYHVAHPQEILQRLRSSEGSLYSMYPAFALWAGKPVTPWYYQADSLVPRINHWIGDKEFLDVFAASGALVLYSSELDEYPNARGYLATHFRLAYEDPDWALWLRLARGPRERPPSTDSAAGPGSLPR